jgi:hypothetical protein
MVPFPAEDRHKSATQENATGRFWFAENCAPGCATCVSLNKGPFVGESPTTLCHYDFADRDRAFACSMSDSVIRNLNDCTISRAPGYPNHEEGRATHTILRGKCESVSFRFSFFGNKRVTPVDF